MSGTRRVAIVYKDMPHYRVAFFNGLRERLAVSGVELDLIYGQPSGQSIEKRDSRDLEWGRFVRSKTFKLGGTTFYWQPVLKYLRGADLVIVEQASRLLVNHVLLLENLLGVRKVALWGHGRNFQSARPGGLRERFKRAYSRSAHWWFAYNETSAQIVIATGFPASRTSVVQNAIDTGVLLEQVASVRQTDVDALRARLGLEGSQVCLFLGSMYAERRLPFLIEAAERVRSRVPGFELVLVGSGPDGRIAEEAAQDHPWIHHVGAVFGDELACYLASARVLLMPGVVGLGILDSFAAGVPMVTTLLPQHGPEIEYLIDGENGVMVSDAASASAYADAVADLLLDPERYARLVEGCKRSAREYSIEVMVDRFAQGVMKALEAE